MLNSLLNKITHADCLEVMKQLPDKCIDLILTDPPYGIGISKRGVLGSVNKHTNAPVTDYGKDDWDDDVPGQEYFDEMFRISKNQIIFGGNFMIEQIRKNTPCMIVWDKDNTGNYADCELAWTSFSCAVKKYTWRWNGMIQQDMKNKEFRIHPTQKPVPLLEMILRDFYKKQNSTGVVLDCFSGSGSTAIACYKLGIPFIAIEKSKKYVEKSKERLEDFAAQGRLFVI